MGKATAVLHAIQQEMVYTARHHPEEQGHTESTIGRREFRNAVLFNVIESCCQTLLTAALERCRKILAVEQERPAACHSGSCIDGFELVGSLYVAGGASGALLTMLKLGSCSLMTSQVVC